MTLTITPDQLRAIAPAARARADLYAGPLAVAAARFDITTPQRLAAFLGQLAEESGSFTATVENLNYSADRLRQVWPIRFLDDVIAAQYARQPERIANRVYGGRMGNGAEESGDGWKFRGRGLIQVTGRQNYAATAATLNLPLVDHPEMLEEPINAALSAACYWCRAGCNQLADQDDYPTITRRINGGMTNYASRVSYWRAARKVFGLTEMPAAVVPQVHAGA